MIISKKKYEKLNNDLVDAKAKVDDAKKELDDENKIMRATLLIKEQRDQLKAERDTIIDDLSWYKAKVSRLERANDKFRSRLNEFLEHDYDNQKLYEENRNLLSEVSQHIGNKPSSGTYKYFRAKLDGIGIKEGES